VEKKDVSNVAKKIFEVFRDPTRKPLPASPIKSILKKTLALKKKELPAKRPIGKKLARAYLPIKVVCCKCKIVRLLPEKYRAKYDKQAWKTTFLCYKIKLRQFKCFKDYSFYDTAFKLPPPV